MSKNLKDIVAVKQREAMTTNDDGGQRYSGHWPPAYWERKRHEYAGLAMQGLMARRPDSSPFDLVVGCAVKLADMLIAELKK